MIRRQLRRSNPKIFPSYDVVVLDCEGSEKSIVQNIEANRVIVETHGWLGSPASLIKDKLRDRGYKIIDEQIDIPERGNKILAAERTT